jgi:Ca2+-transporting ATPase
VRDTNLHEQLRAQPTAAAAAAVSAGDNIHTARHIARECGILTGDGIALEGPEFRNMPIHDLLPLLPRLQVSVQSCTKS